jgi:hypothetical protein
MKPAPEFTNWMNAFFTSYYYHRPVNATFIGIHDHDHRLPDFSENGAGDTLSDMQGLLRESLKIKPESLSSIEAIDLRLAQGFLKTQIWEYQSSHFHRGNPSTYSGEAVFSVMSLFLTEFGSFVERIDSAKERLDAIPAFLEQGQHTVKSAPHAWTERAIRECEGALAFLTEGIDLLMTANKIENRAFKIAADGAANAFTTFQTYLKKELRSRTSDHYACGDAALDLYLHHGHFLDMDADDMVRYAEAQMALAEQYLTDHVSDFGAADKQTVLEKCSEIHPDLEGYYSRYRELWEQVRQVTEDKALLTWPHFPIRYVPRPGWARKAAPYLYFLFYRSPAAFNRPPIHDYLVTPIDPTLPVHEQQRLLRSTNECVIKLNHVIHHGSIGHHVQNWHAFRSPSRIGQIAAVDCASRIAMFCGGTMAEGWACYATDLMGEVGFLTPLEQYAEKQSRKRMCARAIVDVRLHQGRLTLEQAAEYYVQHAGMGREAAMGEAVKNSMFPGAAVMYVMGTDTIHKLRTEMALSRSGRFALRTFHDEFLSYGSIPVTLISEDMKAKVKHA